MLLKEIRKIHRASRRTYGSLRHHVALTDGRQPIGRHRVAHLMRKDRIRGRSADLWCTDPALHEHYVAIPNRKQGFMLMAPDQPRLGDVTYLEIGRRWRYFLVAMAQYNRRIIGWAPGQEESSALTLKTLDQAVRRRKPGQGGVIHSDPGAKYAAFAYRGRLASAGLLRSRNLPPPIAVDALMNSHFHSMTSHLIHRVSFNRDTYYLAAICSCLPFYNALRCHSALEYQTPANHEFRRVA